MESGLESHRTRALENALELSKVRIGLETTEIRVRNDANRYCGSDAGVDAAPAAVGPDPPSGVPQKPSVLSHSSFSPDIYPRAGAASARGSGRGSGAAFVRENLRFLQVSLSVSLSRERASGRPSRLRRWCLRARALRRRRRNTTFLGLPPHAFFPNESRGTRAGTRHQTRRVGPRGLGRRLGRRLLHGQDRGHAQALRPLLQPQRALRPPQKRRPRRRLENLLALSRTV